MKQPKIEIPFVAKRSHGDAPWQDFGGPISEYDFWAPHICGIACARSLILSADDATPSMYSLTRQALDLGVFRIKDDQSVEGAFHAPLVALLQQYGIAATVFARLAFRCIWKLTNDGVLILSINLAKVRIDLSGSHLVLITGREDHYARIHDNARLLCKSGISCRIHKSKLAAISNDRGIFVPWTSLARGPIGLTKPA
jgi:hypothetical protein